MTGPDAKAAIVGDVLARIAAEQAQPSGDVLERVQPLDWSEFWATDYGSVDWIAEPLLAAGRATALFSEAKAGKSLFTLEMVAAVATGGTFLGRELPPRTVCYFDYENHLGDIQERLRDMGYEGEVFERLHYFPLPILAPLDTEQGGNELRALIEHYAPDVVVLDTLSRTTEGGENDADTYRNFYAHTGMMIKRAGAAYLRLDHEGKDAAKGARGSSAKRDDVDFVWQLRKSANDRLTLLRTHSRTSWGDDRLTVERITEPKLMHRITTATKVDRDAWEPTVIMARVSKALASAAPAGLSRKAIESRVQGKGTTIRQATDLLAAQGYARVDESGGSHTHYHVKPYEEPAA